MSEYTSEQLSRAVAEKLGYEFLSYFKMHGTSYLFVRRPKGEPQLVRSWADSVDMALSLPKTSLDVEYPMTYSNPTYMVSVSDRGTEPEHTVWASGTTLAQAIVLSWLRNHGIFTK